MNSNQIKCFLSVGKTVSFTKSAQDLYLSQSTISKNIQKLEAELGVKLLARTHQKVSLTDKGKVFFVKMLEINQEIDNLIKQIQTEDKKQKVKIYLGYTDVPFEEAYLPIVMRLVNQELNINLRMRLIDPNSSIKLDELIKNDSLDYLLFQKDYFSNNSAIVFKPLFKKSFSVLVSNTDPLFSKQTLDLNDLKNRHLLIWDAHNSLPTVRYLLDKIDASDLNCTCQKVSDIMALTDYVLTNKGIGIIPSILYDKNDKSVRYIPLNCDIPIVYGLAYRKELDKKSYSNSLYNVFNKAVKIAASKW